MATLANLRCVSAGLRPELAAVTALEIEDRPLGGGAFGQNYVCRTLNGSAPPLPLVVKVLTDDGKGSARRGCETIHKLMARLGDLDSRSRQRGEPALSDVPALLAVPQFAFEATLCGQSVCGYGALRLDTEGYVPFEEFTDGDPGHAGTYLALPLPTRLQIALDLAHGMRLLDEIAFVHGDINPQNLFVNPAGAHLALIDFDSGAVVENPGDRPATWGKPGDWLAPEITARLAGTSGAGQPVPVDRFSDAWALGVGIHYLLFLHHPLVYLADFGTNTLRAYLAGNLWPEIDPGDRLYHHANDAVYRRYRQELPALPTPVRSAFDVLLNQGTFAPDQRPDGVAWARALGATHRLPAILRFEADPLLVPAGGAVTLRWQAQDAHRLWLSGVGDVTGRAQAVVTPRHDTRFTLTAASAWGQAQEATPLVRVVQAPAPAPFCVPGPPRSLFPGPGGHGGGFPTPPGRPGLRVPRGLSQLPRVAGIGFFGGCGLPLLRRRLTTLRLPLPGLRRP